MVAAQRFERFLLPDARCAERRRRDVGVRIHLARKIQVDLSHGAAFRRGTANRPEQHGEHGLQKAAAQNQKTGVESAFESPDAARLKYDQRHQRIQAEVAGARADRNQHSGDECPQRGDHHRRQWMFPRHRSNEHGHRAECAPHQHPAGALPVGIGAIGEGDVQRAGSHGNRAQWIAERHPDSERQRHGRRIPERQPAAIDFALFDSPERKPECGAGIRLRLLRHVRINIGCQAS